MHHSNSPFLLAQTLAEQLLLAEPTGSTKASADSPEMPDTDIVICTNGNSVPQRTTLTLKLRKNTLTTKEVANTQVYHNNLHLKLK